MAEINPSDGNNFDKGLNLEREFSVFMKEKLNWQGVKIRATVKAFNNARGTNVDIIAWGYDSRGIKYRKITKWTLGTTFVAVITGFICLFTGYGTLGEWLIIISAIIESFGFMYLFLSKHFKVRHAWVECKNLKTEVTHAQITNMLARHKQYVSSERREYKFEDLFCVSASGFVENALKTALDNKISCYVREGEGTFRKIVSYWD